MNDEFNNSGMAGEVVTQSTLSDKSKGAAEALCLFLGAFGAHRLYLGKAGSGIVMLLLTLTGIFTSGILVGFALIGLTVFWAVIDFFRLIAGSLVDAQGRKLK